MHNLSVIVNLKIQALHLLDAVTLHDLVMVSKRRNI